jgi:hypothetical protein
MRIEELVDSLRKLEGISVPVGTIKRWAYTEGTICDKPPQPIQKGRGRASNWPEAALEEAAAVWAVRHYGTNTRRLSPEVVKYVNAVADHLYMSPLAFYTLPRVNGPLMRFRQIPYEDVIVQFATDEAPVLDLVPGENNAQKIYLLNELIATWIAAREKVRFSKKWEHVKARQGENNRKVLMHVNGKSEEISATWPLETAARIYLSYKFVSFEPQSLDLIGSEGRIYPLNATFDRVYLFDRSYIVPSRRNEVILLENDVDTRKLFIIADATQDKRFLETVRSEQLTELPQFEVQT